jgi:hypothetical protein
MLKMRKHGGDRGDRHNLCRSPAIVLYWAVKMPPGTAGTIFDIIIIKGYNIKPVPDFIFSNLIYSSQCIISAHGIDLEVCFIIIFVGVYCLVTHCMGGRGVDFFNLLEL